MKQSTLLHEMSPIELNQYFNDLSKLLNELKEKFEPVKPTEYLTRHEVAELLKCDLSTIHNWCKKGKLKPFGLGNRVYFRRTDIESQIKPL